MRRSWNLGCFSCYEIIFYVKDNKTSYILNDCRCNKNIDSIVYNKTIMETVVEITETTDISYMINKERYLTPT